MFFVMELQDDITMMFSDEEFYTISATLAGALRDAKFWIESYREDKEEHPESIKVNSGIKVYAYVNRLSTPVDIINDLMPEPEFFRFELLSYDATEDTLMIFDHRHYGKLAKLIPLRKEIKEKIKKFALEMK